MNALTAAERGYLDNVAQTRSSRRTEYEVIARITRRLRDSAKNAKNDYPAFIEALNDNRKLWQAFLIDIADAKNALPAELKARLVYLAEFTMVHSGKVLSQNASILPLLEVNMAVMRGLNTEGSSK